MKVSDEDLITFLGKVMEVERRYATEQKNVASRRKGDVKELVGNWAERFAAVNAGEGDDAT